MDRIANHDTAWFWTEGTVQTDMASGYPLRTVNLHFRARSSSGMVSTLNDSSESLAAPFPSSVLALRQQMSEWNEETDADKSSGSEIWAIRTQIIEWQLRTASSYHKKNNHHQNQSKGHGEFRSLHISSNGVNESLIKTRVNPHRAHASLVEGKARELTN